MSAYRPEFEAALRLFARVSEAMHERGLPRPILVGGAAAELYSTSALTTGDFDLCSPYQPELEQEMQTLGFVRPSGAGMKTKGLVHPGLALGFEVVATTPMDGSVDRAHILLVQPIGESAQFRVISVEDLIADRMGQYASGTARDRLYRRSCCYRFTPTSIWSIWSGEFVKKAQAIMASKTSRADTETVIDMAELGARVAKRKAELGIVDPTDPSLVKGRNSGGRRTESKKALLKAIKDAGGKW